MSNNLNLLQGFNLVEEIDEQAAETITGGYEVFEIRNKTNYNVSYLIDGTKAPDYAAKPGGDAYWTAYKGGIVKFDTDGRNDFKSSKSYDLSNGGIYEFQYNNTTPGNPYDIELYKVG